MRDGFKQQTQRVTVAAASGCSASVTRLSEPPPRPLGRPSQLRDVFQEWAKRLRGLRAPPLQSSGRHLPECNWTLPTAAATVAALDQRGFSQLRHSGSRRLLDSHVVLNNIANRNCFLLS